jgi:sporulation protein YlmC with PRC-barrel domain
MALRSVDFFRDTNIKQHEVMRKTVLKITVICAACSMLTASAWSQAESQDKQSDDSSSNRSWSTKHLSATGRNNDGAVRASKLTGARVSDSSGQRVGTIQDVLINPSSGRIDFALLSLNTSSTSTSSAYGNKSSTSESTMTSSSSSGKLVPVPWSLLRSSASSSQYSASSEQPTFTLNADQNKLNSAPTVDESDLSQSQWQQRIYSYYGVTPHSSMGASDSPQGEIKGEGARRMEETTPERQQQPTP